MAEAVARSATHKEQCSREVLINVKWEHPDCRTYMLNIDGSCMGNPGVGGIGIKIALQHNPTPVSASDALEVMSWLYFVNLGKAILESCKQHL
ncbi:hypothetical protein HAX54_022294 [Datura stramonium]|uniref:RNase H type-1 domain-containing protein n=1 Tax=Datura stramonium TaxID=4076 RepID=A0ABS8S794_DATST|nr:hypothetical protein [Datura stramonium]